MNRRLLIVGLLIVGMLAALAAWLYSQAIPYSQTLDHGPAPAARANPYLAAEHFLRQQGLNVNHANSLDILPQLEPRQRSLLLLGDRANMTARQVEQVLNWTRAGGRLLFVAEALWDEKTGTSGDLLLDRVQLHQALSKDLKGPPPDAEPDPYPNLTKLWLENEDAPAYFSFDPQFHLEDPNNLADAWANSALATHMMQLPYGEGSITVVTDAELWKNDEIGHYDNAWLLRYLYADTQVTLLFNVDHDGLPSLLLKYFPQALLALVALIGLWLWHVGWRQGPIHMPAPKARRQLSEHLRASADFNLRHHGQAHLLGALQHDLLRRARHRHPGFEQLDFDQQCQALARLSGQADPIIRLALGPLPQKPLASADFSRQVAHLQTLRNAL